MTLVGKKLKRSMAMLLAMLLLFSMWPGYLPQAVAKELTDDHLVLHYEFKDANVSDGVVTPIFGSRVATMTSVSSGSAIDDTENGGKGAISFNGAGDSGLKLPEDMFENINGDDGFTISFDYAINSGANQYSRMFDATPRPFRTKNDGEVGSWRDDEIGIVSGTGVLPSDIYDIMFTTNKGGQWGTATQNTIRFSQARPKDSTWRSMIITMKEDSFQVYDNGIMVFNSDGNADVLKALDELFDTSGNTSYNIQKYTNVYLGRSMYQSDSNFNGMISDFKFYDTYKDSSLILDPPDAPTNVGANAGNAQATVTFTPPTYTGSGPITGYTVTSNPGGKTATGTSSPITVTDLTNGTAYTFTVTATNAIGTGEASVASNSITPNDVAAAPGVPTDVTALAGDTKATVSFTAPSDNGSAITGYTVTSNPEGKTATGTTSPITVTGLTNGTSYTFTVTATNAIGTGIASAASNSIKPFSKGELPDDNLVLHYDFSAANVSGANVTDIESGKVATMVAAGTANEIVVKDGRNAISFNANADSGLKLPSDMFASINGTDGFTIAFDYAINSGANQYSRMFDATPRGFRTKNSGDFNDWLDDELGVVSSTGAVATGDAYDILFTVGKGGTASGQKRNKLQFTANRPKDNTWRSTIITMKEDAFQVYDNGNLVFNSVGNADVLSALTVLFDTSGNLNYNITKYTNVYLGRSMYLSDTNFNGMISDFKFYDAYMAPSLILDLPGAPTAVTASAGNTQATVTFAAPANAGSSPITSYTVTSNPEGKTATGTTSPITVTGLTNGTAYTFTVTAENWIGTGVVSAPSGSVTPNEGAAAPGVPTNVTVLAGDTKATVSFTAPSDNGSPITGYTVTSNPDGIEATGAESPITVTGLTNGTSYTFTVAAINDIGTGIASAPTDAIIPFSKGELPDENLLLHYDFSAANVSRTTVTDIKSNKEATMVATGTANDIVVNQGRNAISFNANANSGLKLPEDMFANINGDDGFTVSFDYAINSAASQYSRMFDATPRGFRTSNNGENGGWTDEEIGVVSGLGKAPSGYQPYDVFFTVKNSQNKILFADPRPKDSSWHTLIMTMKKNTFQVYNDGEMVFTSRNPDLIPYTTQAEMIAAMEYLFSKAANPEYNITMFKNVYLGRSMYQSDSNFNGMISDFKFYNKYIKPSQILDPRSITNIDHITIDGVDYDFEDGDGITIEIEDRNLVPTADDIIVTPAVGGVVTHVTRVTGATTPTFQIKATALDNVTVDYYLVTFKTPAEDKLLEFIMDEEGTEIGRYGTGFLYGVAEPDIPSYGLVSALKPTVAVQKAPMGMQHPSGDALRVADSYIEAGIEQIQIYIQDHYLEWPYENAGLSPWNLDNILADYIPKMMALVRESEADRNSDKFTYVTFNEPDGIWFSNRFEDYLKAYKATYEAIKAEFPDARIVAMGETGYYSNHWNRFIEYTKANNCFPDVVSWHELQDDAVTSMQAHIQDYYDLMDKYGMGDIAAKTPIVINEYGRIGDDMGMGGKLIRYIARMEYNDVYGAMAFWHKSNSLNELAATANEPNGAWWLTKWYADMSGNKVALNPYGVAIQDLYGLASINNESKTAYALFGGGTGTQKVALNHLDKTTAFNGTDTVHVKLYKAKYTGFLGALADPQILFDGNLALENGELMLEVTGADERDSFYAVVTPATGTAVTLDSYTPVWTTTIQANGIENVTFANAGSGIDVNASNNGYRTLSASTNSNIEFSVTVPNPGRYSVELFFSNVHPDHPQHSRPGAEGAIAPVSMSVDGAAATTEYLSTTVKNMFFTSKTFYLDFAAAGNHTIRFTGIASDNGGRAVRVDRLDATYVGAVGSYAPVYEYIAREFVTDQVGNTTLFNVVVKDDGYYDLSISANGNGAAKIERKVLNYGANAKTQTPVTTRWEEVVSATLTNGVADPGALYLRAGINQIKVTADGLKTLTVTYNPVITASKSILELDAKDATLGGNVASKTLPAARLASETVVAGFGEGAANTLSFTVNAPEAGSYSLLVNYIQNEGAPSGAGGYLHPYNTDLVERYAQFTVNSGTPKTVYFGNTLCWNVSGTTVVTLDLAEGENTIKISNDASYRFAGDTHKQYTPDFVKFAMYESFVPNVVVPLTVPGAPTNVTAVAGNAQAVVTFTAPADNGGSEITGYTVTSIPDGKTAIGTSSPITVTGLTNGTAYNFIVTATNSIGTSPISLASSAVTPSGGGSGNSGNSGNSSSTTTTTPTDDSAKILVDNQLVDAGKVTVEGNTTTVAINQATLQKQLDTAADNVTIVIPANTGTAVAQLLIKNVEDMAGNSMTLTVQSGIAQYNLPTTAVDTASILRELGVDDATMVSINIAIVTNITGDTQTAVDNVIKLNGSELVIPPIEFKLTATYNGKIVEIDTFSQFVKRTIEVTEEQASKVTTALVIGTDGTSRHVPTHIYQKDGKWYVDINSMTNSTYALVYNKKTFTDTNGKWYESAVNEMASRMIISGDSEGLFAGESDITRAEFAAITIRALGLPANGNGTVFSDVTATAWYCGAVGTAYEYGIISGAGNGTFAPNKKITRQEAMTIIQRASKLAGFAGSIGSIDSFADAGSVSSWALDAAKFNVGSDLVVGNNGKLRPLDYITRAETASLIFKLLRKAGLVNA